MRRRKSEFSDRGSSCDLEIRSMKSPVLPMSESLVDLVASIREEESEVREILKDDNEQIECCLEVCMIKGTQLEEIDEALKLAKIKQPRVISHVRQLLYLPLYHADTEMFALIDTGAQVNLIAEALLASIPHEVLPSSDPIVIHGVGSHQPLLKWIKTTLTLQNGTRVSLVAGVLAQLTCSIILGMSFLTDIDALINVTSAFMTSRVVGNVALSREKGKALVQTAQVEPEDALDIEIKKRLATDLNAEQCEQAVQLLKKHASLWQNQVRGVMTEIQHYIRLSTAQPVVTRPRYHAETTQEIIRVELEKMLRDHIVQPSISDYASEIVMIKKKTGDWRFCIDFRPLNAVTIKDQYPLPLIRTLLQKIRADKWFSAIDLRSGYWQIPMEPNSQKYTAFRCPSGLYEFCVMPFGLVNAPATFQRCMDTVFKDKLTEGVSVYLDDILIHADTFEKCYQLTQEVLERLAIVHLTVNLEKSQFFFRELRYLGHIVGDGKLRPDPKRVQLMQQRKIPKTLTDVKSLLGVLGYYQQYIHNYAQLVAPMYDLQKGLSNTKRKNRSTLITWTAKHEQNAQKAINSLTTAVLSIPLEGEDFIIETDASDTTIAGILSVVRDSQRIPIEFYGKKLNDTEKRWATRDKEAYAIVKSVQKFDRFVRGRPVIVESDHESLQWLTAAKEGRVARWANLLSEKELKVRYKKGTENVIADFFTRQVDADADPIESRMLCYWVELNPEESALPTLEEIKNAQTLAHPIVEVLVKQKSYTVQKGIILYHGAIYIPESLRGRVIQACHSIKPVNHPGQKGTAKRILKIFNWPRLYQDVVTFIASCYTCQRARHGTEKQQGLYRIHPIRKVMSTVYMDFYEVTYRGQKRKYLTLIDHFSKWAEVFALEAITASAVAKRILSDWIQRWGVPEFLISDNDLSFCNNIMDKLVQQMQITKLTSTPYHPKGNSIIEILHKTLNRGFRNFRDTNVNIDEVMQDILFAYRCTPHSSTGNTPFFLLLGYDPALIPTIDWRFENDIQEQDRLRYLNLIRQEVHVRANYIAEQLNRERNKERRDVKFEEGQLVLWAVPKLQRQAYVDTSEKAYPMWSMPHRVVKKVTDTTAWLQDLLTQKTVKAHISMCRFLYPPSCEEQEKEWAEIIMEQALSFHKPEDVPLIIEAVFQRLRHPQLEPSATHLAEEEGERIIQIRKRRRTEPQVSVARLLNHTQPQVNIAGIDKDITALLPYGWFPERARALKGEVGEENHGNILEQKTSKSRNENGLVLNRIREKSTVSRNIGNGLARETTKKVEGSNIQSA